MTNGRERPFRHTISIIHADTNVIENASICCQARQLYDSSRREIDGPGISL